ncbi:uncharacterized protein J3D65DRAFT_457032 [Phyllosticta citribraziliensis]|uniref:Uncharacterized protein n=1 Tax=Phyllosticta citribraziliensis TaxID=989973 RepID=A0ABR1LGJ2_9PEZI
MDRLADCLPIFFPLRGGSSASPALLCSAGGASLQEMVFPPPVCTHASQPPLDKTTPFADTFPPGPRPSIPTYKRSLIPPAPSHAYTNPRTHTQHTFSCGMYVGTTAQRYGTVRYSPKARPVCERTHALFPTPDHLPFRTRANVRHCWRSLACAAVGRPSAAPDAHALHPSAHSRLVSAAERARLACWLRVTAGSGSRMGPIALGAAPCIDRQ